MSLQEILPVSNSLSDVVVCSCILSDLCLWSFWLLAMIHTRKLPVLLVFTVCLNAGALHDIWDRGIQKQQIRDRHFSSCFCSQSDFSRTTSSMAVPHNCISFLEHHQVSFKYAWGISSSVSGSLISLADWCSRCIMLSPSVTSSFLCIFDPFTI